MQNDIIYCFRYPEQILLVDDQPDNLFLLQQILEEEGYESECVNNGFDALDQITANPPDLLMLDLGLPGMDGYEVIRRIRSSEWLPFIPIVLMTAHGAHYALRGFEVGAQSCVCLPYEIDNLLSKVKNLLSLKQTIRQQQLLC
ncbi:response regulator [Egbenema bharatensis]|uniref:response regulator n=1 Tax=Egbenema bharatensis TaxID=3463334 RepID=UPI003A8AB655